MVDFKKIMITKGEPEEPLVEPDDLWVDDDPDFDAMFVEERDLDESYNLCPDLYIIDMAFEVEQPIKPVDDPIDILALNGTISDYTSEQTHA